MIWPSFLRPGDKAALIAPSGPVPQNKMESIIAGVQSFGINPVVYPGCYENRGYLAGEDRRRAADVQDAFANPNIKAVLCVRGGYGAHRLMEYLDWDAIAASRKWLYGYSDITALHIEMNRRGVVSWHSPMPGEQWCDLLPFARQSLKNALFGPPPERVLNPKDEPLRAISGGYACGALCGGNLTLVTVTLGTYYEIDTKGKILFLEEVDEALYRVDRMLLQLRHAGKFSQCAGIIFGRFTRCDPPAGKPSLSLSEIFSDLLGDLQIPILTGLACGHAQPSICLPLGARVILEVTK